MVRTFVNTYKFSFAEKVNGLIYFLKKVPLIGKKIPESIYKETKTKLTIGTIFEVISFLLRFLGKAIYILLMVLLPAMFFARNGGDSKEIAIHIFFFLSLVMGPFVNVTVLEGMKKPFKMIRLMRVNPRKYFVGQIVYARMVNFIWFIPAMLLICSPVNAIILATEFIAIKSFGEAVELFIYDRSNIMLPTKPWFNVVAIVIGLLLAYLLPYLGIVIDVGSFLYSILGLLIIVIVGVLSILYIFQYRGFNNLSKVIITKNMMSNGEDVVVQATFSDVKIDEKKIKAKDLDSRKYENKRGYEYINAIFFMRHRKLIVTATKNRTIAIIILSLGIIGAIVLMPEIKADLLRIMQKTASAWVFIMYAMSTSQKVAKAMFYNCDVSLLRYGYYREGKVIISNFTARLKRVVILNLIPAVALCIGMCSIIVATGQINAIMNMIPMFLSIICLSCFFSIHHLFLYYTIQPYTSQLTIKSPLFSGINGITYFISYMCLSLDGSSYLFSIGVIVVTLIYMIIALVITYNVAPRTFKLK
ncbi:hypothetical protein [Clostridium sp.]|uniref:hypothetical protein n=1 Tax=Clostridium sp. TaxID=1506 RepID=UPI00321620E3